VARITGRPSRMRLELAQARRGTMGKVFAVIVVVIALASAVPIITHHWFGSTIDLSPPQDISTHGHAIDEQLSETMIEAGLSFLAAQFVLAFFVWKFSNRAANAEIKTFPGGAKWLVIAALALVGTEMLALGVLGQRAWATVYFTQRKRTHFRCKRKQANSLFISGIRCRRQIR